IHFEDGNWPDTRNGSSTRNRILNAPLADVPVLNMSSTNSSLADVDCFLYFNLSHTAFLSNSSVTAAAIQWAQGGNPCSVSPATPSPTATNTPLPTATTAPAATATPAPTQAPTCSFWERLFRRC